MKLQLVRFWNFTKAHILQGKWCFKIFGMSNMSRPKNTGHLEWNLMGDSSEFKNNGDSKEVL